MVEARSKFNILTGKPTGKRLLGMLGCRWEENIRKVLKEIGIKKRSWVDSVQDRDYWKALENSASNPRDP